MSGVDAVLVGAVLMGSGNPEAETKELVQAGTG